LFSNSKNNVVYRKLISIFGMVQQKGVRGRTSDNALIKELLDWAPSAKLEDGLAKTYEWIEKQAKS